MELRHLRYFVAIAEERSFTRAAERLWVAQPGLSTQIRRLEVELGVRLFDRHTRGVEVTAAGEVFLERARAVLAAADIARSTGRDLDDGVVGSLRLGLSTLLAWEPSSSLLEDFAQARPGIEIVLQEAYGGALARDLRDGRLDAMIAPTVFAAGDFRRAEIAAQPWVVLVAESHELGSDRPIEPACLDGEELLVTGHRDGTGYDLVVRETFDALGAAPVLRSGGTGPALMRSVMGGQALALTTGAAALPSGVFARRLVGAEKLAFGLFWRAQTPSPALKELITAATGVPARSDPRARLALAA